MERRTPTIRIAAFLELALLLGFVLGDLAATLCLLGVEYALRLFAPMAPPPLWALAGRVSGAATGKSDPRIRSSWFGRLAAVSALSMIPGERFVEALAVSGIMAADLLLDVMIGRSLFAVVLSPLARRIAGATAPVDRILTRIVGAPFASRRARLRSAMIVCGVAVGSGLGILGIKFHVHSLGIRSHAYINDGGYWMPEPDIGYRNRDDIARWSYLTEWQQTTKGGFKHHEPVSAKKPDGVLRIVGVGDSVTWGIGASQTNTYLGMLERMLNPTAPCETINGGVIGYSSFQEMKFIEKYVLPLNPDVILINYCTRDVLPTEDPFGLGRELLIRRLRSIEGTRIRESERDTFEALMRLFEEDAVWAAFRESPESVKSLAFRLLVEDSYREMNELCRDHGVRLIALLIPPETREETYPVEAERLMRVFEGEGIEYLNLIDDMKREPRPSGRGAEGAFKLRLPFKLRDLQTIRLYQEYQWMHENLKYIDYYHPSWKGNRIVAERVSQLLRAR